MAHEHEQNESPAAGDSAISEAMDLALDALFNMGIAARRSALDEHILEIPSSGARIRVDPLAAHLASAPADQRAALASDFVWHAMQRAESFDVASLSDLDLSLGIRTLLLPADDEPTGERTYARPVADGLVGVLAVEQRGKVAILSDADLAALDRPVDELFADGQARVNMETVQSTDIGGGILAVEGDGIYVAARVLDVPALLDDLGLEAPRGALVVPLNQSVILVAAPAPERALDTLQAIAQAGWSLASSQQVPLSGGIISTNVYYYHPGAPLEVAAFWRSGEEAAAIEGEPAGQGGLQLVLNPSPAFVAQMGLGEGGVTPS